MCKIILFSNQFDCTRCIVKVEIGSAPWTAPKEFPFFGINKRMTVFPKACLSVSGLASIEPCVLSCLLRDSD